MCEQTVHHRILGDRTIYYNGKVMSEAKGTSKPSKNETKWNQMYELLVEYKQTHGDALVPNRFPKLGNWVSTQRRYYKEYKSGKETPLTESRIHLLESIGFAWATKDPRHVPWEQRYQELQEYKILNGNCLVPIGYKPNIQLANWVSTQRQEYKLWKKKKPCRITSEKVQKLISLGFSFEPPRGGKRLRKRKSSDDSSSTMSYTDSVYSNRNLDVMKEEHVVAKRTKLPHPTYSRPSSSKMTSTPTNYSQYQHQHTMPPLSTPTYAQSPQKYQDSSWSTFFQHYRALSERGINFANNPQYHGINAWCNHQRYQYQLWLQNPLTSDLTQNQIDLLNLVQFDWMMKSPTTPSKPRTSFTELSETEDISPSNISQFSTDHLTEEAAQLLLSLSSSSGSPGDEKSDKESPEEKDGKVKHV